MSTDNIQVWDGIFPAVNPKAKFSGGDGTEFNPFLIADGTDLAQIATNIKNSEGAITYEGVYFKLSAHIELNENPITPALVNVNTYGTAGYPTTVYEWVPIGGALAGDEDTGEVYFFKGDFNGNNKIISNAFYNHATPNPSSGHKDPVAEQNSVGIFGCLGTGAKVYDLTTAGGFIAGSNSVGGIIGRSWGATITNCTNGNFVYAIGANGTGGVAGTSWVFEPEQPTVANEVRPAINKCTNTGTVISNYTNNKGHRSGAAGGIVGENEGNVINCFNNGLVSGLFNAGGIVGSNQNKSSGDPSIIVTPGLINNCYNWANIGTTSAVGGHIPGITADCAGGIIGYQTGNCQNAYNRGVITINPYTPPEPGPGIDTSPTIGQIIGELNTVLSNSNDIFFNSDIHYLLGGTPSGGVGRDDHGASSCDAYEGDEIGLEDLTLALNNWVNGHNPSSTYLNWIQDVNFWPVF